MKRLTILIALIMVVSVAAFVWWNRGNQAVNPSNTSPKIFIINSGESVREIGNNLKKEGLIRDPIVLFLSIKFSGKEKNIQAGDYRLSPSMDLKTILDNLNHGTLDRWVTIPEGLRAEEYADIFKKSFPQYTDAWLPVLKINQGYLYPDTYLFPKDADVDSIVATMKNTFFEKVAPLGLTKDSPHLREIVILASLLEREARNDSEKPIIAGILENRLNAGMPLQIDATIQYAKGYNTKEKKWWSEVFLDDYRGIVSSYNTYLNPGLPPGPISNPGRGSLQAAVSPADTPYVYYLHDKNGKIHFAKTSAEHEKNVEKYIQ